jgi:hypothetical protein
MDFDLKNMKVENIIKSSKIILVFSKSTYQRPFYCNVGASQRSVRHSALTNTFTIVMPLLCYISFIDQEDSLTCYALAKQAASLCQEEVDSVAGSAIPHLLTGLSQVILLKFPPMWKALELSMTPCVQDDCTSL